MKQQKFLYTAIIVISILIVTPALVYFYHFGNGGWSTKNNDWASFGSFLSVFVGAGIGLLNLYALYHIAKLVSSEEQKRIDKQVEIDNDRIAKQTKFELDRIDKQNEIDEQRIARQMEFENQRFEKNSAFELQRMEIQKQYDDKRNLNIIIIQAINELIDIRKKYSFSEFEINHIKKLSDFYVDFYKKYSFIFGEYSFKIKTCCDFQNIALDMINFKYKKITNLQIEEDMIHFFSDLEMLDYKALKYPAIFGLINAKDLDTLSEYVFYFNAGNEDLLMLLNNFVLNRDLDFKFRSLSQLEDGYKKYKKHFKDGFDKSIIQ